MPWLRNLVRNLWHRGHVEQDLDQEVRAHVDLLVEQHTANGMNEIMARRAARLELGGADQVKEAVRDIRRGVWLEQSWRDLRYGVRTLRKTPGFTAVAVVTLALGIGANTAIFSAVDTILIRPLPYADPDRLVMVWEDATAAGFPRNTPAPGNYTEWVRLSHVFTAMAATAPSSSNVTGDGLPEQLNGRRATPNFFSVCGVQPILGRTFTDDEDRAGARVVVISHGLWLRRSAATRPLSVRRCK